MHKEDELYHYGVPGMRWGVRNKVSKSERISSRAEKRKWSKDATESAKLKTKKMSQMSNDELKTLNKRRDLEENYKRLNPNTIKKAIAITSSIVATMGTALALINTGKKFIDLGRNTANAYSKVKSDKFMKSINDPKALSKIDLSKTTYEQFMKMK